MRIATWNINGLRARLDFLLHWLRAREPDVVGLQELKLRDEDFPRDVLEAEGYSVATHGQKAWNGVAVLSRSPVEVVERGLPGQEELGARLLTVDTAGLSFTTIYCPNGKNVAHEDFGRKLAWLDRLIEHWDDCGGEGRVLCGDFNLCPTGLDSWDEERLRGRIFHTDAERERWERLLASGLVDLFRHRHPERRAYSWWDYRGGAFHRKMGLRIDFLLATPDVARRAAEVEIDREYRKKKDGMTASDHAPVMAELE